MKFNIKDSFLNISPEIYYLEIILPKTIFGEEFFLITDIARR